MYLCSSAVFIYLKDIFEGYLQPMKQLLTICLLPALPLVSPALLGAPESPSQTFYAGAIRQ